MMISLELSMESAMAEVKPLRIGSWKSSRMVNGLGAAALDPLESALRNKSISADLDWVDNKGSRFE
jgi:hypothetical protein